MVLKYIDVSFKTEMGVLKKLANLKQLLKVPRNKLNKILFK